MDAATTAARRTGVPPYAYLMWVVAGSGFAAMATPYREYAYWPLMVAFLVTFAAFVGDTKGNKGALRKPFLA